MEKLMEMFARRSQPYYGEGASDLQEIANRLERLRRRVYHEGSPRLGGRSLLIDSSELRELADRLWELGCRDLASNIGNYGSLKLGERSTVWVSTQAIAVFINILRRCGVSPNIEPEPVFARQPEVKPEPVIEIRLEPASEPPAVFGLHFDRNGFRIYGHPRDHYRPFRQRDQATATAYYRR